jgi:hypothetical protein
MIAGGAAPAPGGSDAKSRMVSVDKIFGAVGSVCDTRGGEGVNLTNPSNRGISGDLKMKGNPPRA